MLIKDYLLKSANATVTVTPSDFYGVMSWKLSDGTKLDDLPEMFLAKYNGEDVIVVVTKHEVRGGHGEPSYMGNEANIMNLKDNSVKPMKWGETVTVNLDLLYFNLETNLKAKYNDVR